MKKLVLLFIGLISISAAAQQLPMFSSYYYKPYFYNPALAGDNESNEIFGINRNQFSDFQGAPVFNIVSVDGKLKRLKAYAGFLAANQRKGILNNTNLSAAYAYRANINENVYFRLGLSIGILDQSVNYGKIQVQNYADPYLFLTSQRRTVMDANAGFSFHAAGLQLGFSVPQIFGNKLNYNDAVSIRSYYQASRHMLGSLRYDIPVNKEKEMYVVPFGLLRFVANAPIQYDGGLLFEWKDKFWIGGAYKSNYAVGINAGITLNRRLSVGYSYDVMIGDIANYAGISHEIMVAFKVGKLRYKQGDDTLTPQDYKIQDLQNQIDEIKKNGVKASGNTNATVKTNTNPTNTTKEVKKEEVVKATQTQFNGKNAVKENGIYILTNKASDFVYSTGTLAKKGYYVVVESVFYKDYAENEAKRYTSFGFPDAEVFMDKNSKFHYIFIHYAPSKEDAMDKVIEAKLAGVPDVWIQVLVE